ncbi:doublesex- and mab-3-related transcription factor B1-like [Trachinotus anak]|uniref:doublesex- and mab-3-related transcription factor B1-like n=1 Tax=Trachinotus anak TaxID=443729 RepID=UPI0039F20F45
MGHTCRCEGLFFSAGGHWSSGGICYQVNVLMSLSKEELTVAAAAEPGPRRPKCTRCRHHGIIVPQKGHMRHCPFLKCDCWKCFLITQRTQITTLQRNLKKAESKPQDERRRRRRPCDRRPAAEGTAGAVGPDGGARQPATSGPMNPRSAGVPEGAAVSTRSPPEPRSRPAAGGGQVAAGAGSEEPRPRAEEGPCPVSNAPYCSDVGQTPPLPVIQFPFRMPGRYPSGFALCPNFLFNMPQLPPAGFYNGGFCGAQIFPHLQQGAVHYPPPPEPGPPADCRPVFYTLQPPPLPDAFQEELMSRQYPQPPLPKHSEPDIEVLD